MSSLAIGLMQLEVTWYKILLIGEQENVTRLHWEMQTKKITLFELNVFYMYFGVWHILLLLIMAYLVQCNLQVKKAHCPKQLVSSISTRRENI